ncbi:MAG TPA: hypothetical protein VFE50_05925 [Cyclobacteriaceae bacterium]|nr:hypothetical protein [Cyclobacteriaceae bacterium]
MGIVGRGIYYLTHWEVWHWFVKYIIIGPAWLWFCFRSKSLWFFTPSNPGITFGGFLGETKRDSYRHLPPGSYPKSIYISPRSTFPDVKSDVAANGFRFPFVVKPDVGMMGFMFRKIESFDQLRQYHAAMRSDYIVQEYSEYPVEISVFYYRFPGEAKGHISGVVRKECMSVIGDGTSTLRQLIINYPRARFRTKELFSKHSGRLDDILEKDQEFVLSDALNLSRGGRLVSLEREIDDQLIRVFDNLSDQFYYGRYDIKCTSLDDLKQGKNFTILEYNGCGGEPHHVYGDGSSFFRACWVLASHWHALYRISKLNRDKGIKVWSHAEGAAHMRKALAHFEELKRLDHTFTFKTEKEKSISRTIFPPVSEWAFQKNILHS